MSQWTKRYKIPIEANPGSYARSAVFERKIWTMCEIKNGTGSQSFKSHLSVFDPVSEEFTEMNCVYPGAWPLRLNFLVSDGTALYMWRSQSYHFLYKLNRATLEWKEIMTIRKDYGSWKSIVIFDRVMHILTLDYLHHVIMIEIDLSRKMVLGQKELSTVGPSWNGVFSIHENKLLLIEAFMGRRKVSWIRDGKVTEEIGNEKQSHVDPLYEEPVQSTVNLAYVYIDSNFETHTFDFDSHSWKSEVTHPDWIVPKNAMKIFSAMEMNRSIYALILHLEQGHFELHKLDLVEPGEQ